ncbi:tetratricopeptide repeat protein [Microbacterium sp.]|uniref:tetratricopeptide repeat protein n=1 Tax=Microbacterium sp. TaxID=51671 RepID=UPI0039E645F6
MSARHGERDDQTSETASAADDLADRAYIEYENGDLVAAQVLLEQAVALADAGVWIWLNLGLVRGEQDDWQGAIAAYSAVVDRDPEALAWRGLAYEEAGDPVAARRDYEAALPLFPDHVSLLVNLGMLDLEEGRVAEAEKRLSHAARLNPASGWQLSDVYVAQARVEDAKRVLRRAVEAGELRAYFDVVILDLLLEDLMTARRDLEAASEAGLDWDSQDRRTILEGLEGDPSLRADLLADLNAKRVLPTLVKFVKTAYRDRHPA